MATTEAGSDMQAIIAELENCTQIHSQRAGHYLRDAWERHGPAVLARLRDQDKELKARGEILDAITEAAGTGNSWLSVTDWRKRLRDCASDSEQHDISRTEWQRNRGDGITLYVVADCFAAYFDDANALWSEADDTRPMHHVMVESDPPHRTLIHALHLVEWVQYLASMCMPVQIMERGDSDGAED